MSQNYTRDLFRSLRNVSRYVNTAESISLQFEPNHRFSAYDDCHTFFAQMMLQCLKQCGKFYSNWKTNHDSKSWTIQSEFDAIIDKLIKDSDLNDKFFGCFYKCLKSRPHRKYQVLRPDPILSKIDSTDEFQEHDMVPVCDVGWKINYPYDSVIRVKIIVHAHDKKKVFLHYDQMERTMFPNKR